MQKSLNFLRRGGSSKNNLNNGFDKNIGFNRNVRIVGVASSAILLVVLSLALFPVAPKADTVEATSGTATESSTTITVNQATASVDLTTASADGTFAKSEGAGIASFGVKTTNYTGYTLTIAASDDAKTLTNTAGTGTFTSIDEIIYESTFNNAIYNGKWGYKPSKYNSINNDYYRPSPTTVATTLDVTDQANSVDNTYTITLGARAAYTQPSGTYTKTVILTATSNLSAYSITYADDTNDNTVTNLPDVTTGGTAATSINLSSVTPSRTGYVFDGWCSVATTSSGTACSGTRYNAGAAYGIDQTTSNVVTLHAIWTVPTYSITIKPTTGISSVSLNNQSCSDASGCTVNNLTYGQSYTLTATAASGYNFSGWSNNGAGIVADLTNATTTYTIGEGASTITAIATVAADPPLTATTMQSFTKSMCQTYASNYGITLTDSRDNKTYTVRYINGNCWMTSNLALGANTSNPDSTSVTITKNNTNITANTKTLTLRDLVTNGTSGKVCDNTNGYTTTCSHTSNEGDSVWYNYAAATAGTITGSSNSTEASQDICPYGWRLPTSEEFPSSTYVNAFTPVYGGYYGGGTLSYATTRGWWWSSTASGGTYRIFQTYESGSPSWYLGADGRSRGSYVRCIAK